MTNTLFSFKEPNKVKAAENGFVHYLYGRDPMYLRMLTHFILILSLILLLFL